MLTLTSRERWPEMVCCRCGSEERPLLAWQACSAPSTLVHLRANCAACGRFIKFVPQFEPFIEGRQKMETGNSRLRKVGAMWKPRPGSRAKGSGSVTVNGLRQRFIVLVNDHKKEGSREPDFTLMSSDEPEVDEFARELVSRRSGEAQGSTREPGESSDDDGAF